MSKKSVTENIKLSSFDDLFGGEDTKEGIIEIPTKKLYAFRNHPFKVLDDEKMEDLTESIKENGVLSPILVRSRKQSGYEIISGHRRAHAAVNAGLTSLPAILKELTDDEATVLMVDANIQREEILPSEKAKAFKMKYDAMKNQGVAGNSLKQIGEENGENYKTVQRYIWLARLSDDLLEMVDCKKIGFVQGVSLSALSENEQQLLYELLVDSSIKLSTLQAATIKQLSVDGKLKEDALTKYLVEISKKPLARKITMKQQQLDQYFTPNYSEQEIMDVINNLLKEWKEKNS